jgi:hypothetical protein
MQPRHSSAIVVAAWLLVALAVPGSAQRIDTSGVADDIAKRSSIKKPSAEAPVPGSSKLEPRLEAIAREWRRFGVRGAERASASRGVRLVNLRVAAVIRLVSPDRRPELERALRKSWGEVVTVQGTDVFVQLPIPAIRRISRLSAVETVTLDQTFEPLATPQKENVR